MKELYLAGGCFWCIANKFYYVNGVKDVISGYSGGEEINPTYEQVKSQTTGHRETIKIIYDENVVNYLELLDIFYGSVDPFDDQGQFIDKGHSYTLAVYFQNDSEKEVVTKYLLDKQKSESKKICISIEKFKVFYDAEEYHQRYSEKHPKEFEQELITSKRKKIN